MVRADEGDEAVSHACSTCLRPLDLLSDGKVSRDWRTTGPPVYRGISGLWVTDKAKQSSCSLVVQWNHYREKRCSTHTNKNRRYAASPFKLDSVLTLHGDDTL